VRPTVRLKITALFAILFTLLAAVLVATAYSFMAARTTPEAEAQARSQAFRTALAQAGVTLPESPHQDPGARPGGDPGLIVLGPGAQVEIAIRGIEEQARQNALHDLLRVSILAFVIVAVISVGLSWWLAGRVLRPISEVVREASTLSATSLSRRLPTDGPDDEFRRLKTAFNGMLDRLESAFEARQRFAADASHELRTPLAVLGAMADNLLDGGARTPRAARDLAIEVREQVDRSESLVDSLLTLARADDVRNTRERVDLADVAAEAVSAVADAASRAGVAISLDLSDAPTEGDAVLLGRMAFNALDNAVKYNLRSGGTIECATFVDGEKACMRVANSGPIVEVDQIPRLFERFERGETRTERDGHGLGLPILRRVAEAHGGTATASARPGGGLIVTVVLPRSPEAVGRRE
jgi:signal transduction histidine kinase